MKPRWRFRQGRPALASALHRDGLTPEQYERRDRLHRAYNGICGAEHELVMANELGLVNRLEIIRWELGHVAFPRTAGEDGSK